MTVKDVFDLRRQGRIEEAYDAIRPMYAAHKGRYTTLCMFWTASDIFKKRLEEGRINEAAKILEALKRMQPRVEEINKDLDTQATATPAATATKLPWEKNEQQQSGTSAAAFIASASRRLAKALKDKGSRGSNRSSISDSSQEEFSAISTLSARQQDNRKKQVILAEIAETAEKEPSQEEISAISALSAGQQIASTTSDHSSNSSDSCSNDDLSGHLIVSLDEGIIRPIEGINAPQRVVLACLTAHPGYSVPQISDSTGIPAKSIERHVSVLISRNLIEHRGSKKTGGYYAK
ncbi:MAG: MarR family transcriptional regulator, partial [Bacteroidales bacterium]|nr:MarR family transcriptional regulator [Bacteroidales bacterium]